MGAAMNLFGLRKDGTEFPVDIMLKPMETPAGTAVLSFVRDVTEQHEAAGTCRARNDLQLRSLWRACATTPSTCSIATATS